MHSRTINGIVRYICVYTICIQWWKDEEVLIKRKMRSSIITWIHPISILSFCSVFYHTWILLLVSDFSLPYEIFEIRDMLEKNRPRRSTCCRQWVACCINIRFPVLSISNYYYGCCFRLRFKIMDDDRAEKLCRGCTKLAKVSGIRVIDK